MILNLYTGHQWLVARLFWERRALGNNRRSQVESQGLVLTPALLHSSPCGPMQLASPAAGSQFPMCNWEAV